MQRNDTHEAVICLSVRLKSTFPDKSERFFLFLCLFSFGAAFSLTLFLHFKPEHLLELSDMFLWSNRTKLSLETREIHEQIFPKGFGWFSALDSSRVPQQSGARAPAAAEIANSCVITYLNYELVIN